MIEEEEKNIEKRLNAIILRYKDAFENNDHFKLGVFTKNTITKIYSEKALFREDLLWLFATTNVNNKRLLEIVSSGLSCLNKTSETEEILDTVFIENLTNYLSLNNKFSLTKENESIFLLSASFEPPFEIISSVNDEISLRLLTLSLSVFFAACGKSIRVDFTEMNDFGCSSFLCF